MKHKIARLFLLLSLTADLAYAQGSTEATLCVDHFGVGYANGETCNPIEGEKRKIGPQGVSAAIAAGVVHLNIVSDSNPPQPIDLSPLADAGSVRSLNIFRVGDLDLSPILGSERLLRLSLGADAALALPQLVGGMPGLAELRISAPTRLTGIPGNSSRTDYETPHGSSSQKPIKVVHQRPSFRGFD